MHGLIAIFMNRGEAPNDPFALELVELFRETGQFEKAKAVLQSADGHYDRTLYKLLGEMIDSGTRAPIRFRQ